jgi:hypothetical protein
MPFLTGKAPCHMSPVGQKYAQDLEGVLEGEKVGKIRHNHT